jgi:hypothetical protein
VQDYPATVDGMSGESTQVFVDLINNLPQEIANETAGYLSLVQDEVLLEDKWTIELKWAVGPFRAISEYLYWAAMDQFYQQNAGILQSYVPKSNLRSHPPSTACN